MKSFHCNLLANTIISLLNLSLLCVYPTDHDMMGNTPTRVKHSAPTATDQKRSVAATSENNAGVQSTETEAPNSAHAPTQSSMEKSENVEGPTESSMDVEEPAESSTGTRSKRIRRAPVKFVARPSKQGVGVEEGDTAFLEGNLKNVGSNVKRKSAESSLSAEADESAGVNLQCVGVEMKSGSRNEAAGKKDSANIAKAATKSTNEAKKRKREPVASSSKRLKSNKGDAIYVKPVEVNEVKKQYVSRRKSAISRR